MMLDAFTKQCIIVHDVRFWKQRLVHRDSLLLSLGAVGRWIQEYLGKELAWENSQQQCQRLTTLRTSLPHATTTRRYRACRGPWSHPPQTRSCPWCCRNAPVLSETLPSPPSCSLLPVVRNWVCNRHYHKFSVGFHSFQIQVQTHWC